MATEPKFHSLSTAAPLLGLSPRTLLHWCSMGTIRAYRPNPKGSYLVILQEVEEDIKARAVQPHQDPAELKQRLNAVVDRMKADIAREKKAKKAPEQHGETIH